MHHIIPSAIFTTIERSENSINTSLLASCLYTHLTGSLMTTTDDVQKRRHHLGVKLLPGLLL
ncbi:MAG: hypothetical protein ACLFVO_26045, partial [Chloroflexaceae bacterium]